MSIFFPHGAGNAESGQGRVFRFFRLALAVARLFFAVMSGRFFKYWLPVILWMTLIFGASTSLGRAENTSRVVRPFLLWLNPRMSEQTIEKIHGVIRKTAHFVEYCLLGLLLWRLIHFDPAWAACRSWEFLAALLAAAVYAATDEFHQQFCARPQAAVRDVLLDSCGAGFRPGGALGGAPAAAQKIISVKRPLLPVALCYAGGVVLGQWAHPPLAGLFVAAIAAGLAALAWKAGRGCLLGALLLLAGWTNLERHTAVVSPRDLRVLLGRRNRKM